VADEIVELTADTSREVSSSVLPVTYEHLSEVLQKGDVVFVGQYLFTGSETSSVYLDVVETRPGSVFCKVRNSASLSGVCASCIRRRPVIDQCSCS
jgi:pyruvate kinase